MKLPTQPQAYTVRCMSLIYYETYLMNLIHYEKVRIQKPVVKEEFSGKGKRKMPLRLKFSLNLCSPAHHLLSNPLFVWVVGWNHMCPQTHTAAQAAYLAIEFHRGSEW